MTSHQYGSRWGVDQTPPMHVPHACLPLLRYRTVPDDLRTINNNRNHHEDLVIGCSQ